MEINSRRFRAGLLILKKQCIYYSLVGCRVLNYKVCKRGTNCQKKVIEMGTFSAGRSLPVKRFSSVYTFPRDLTFLKSNRLRSKRFQSSYCAKVGGGAKKNGMGREVIPTLTTFSANSARRLDPQDRIPITSYWTSQIGLFWCWIRQKLKFTMLSQPSPLFSFINLRLTFGNDDDYGKTTFTSY